MDISYISTQLNSKITELCYLNRKQDCLLIFDEGRNTQKQYYLKNDNKYYTAAYHTTYANYYFYVVLNKSNSVMLGGR